MIHAGPRPIRGPCGFWPVTSLLGAWAPVDNPWFLQCWCSSERLLLFGDLRTREGKVEGGSEGARDTERGLGEQTHPGLQGQGPGAKRPCLPLVGSSRSPGAWDPAHSPRLGEMRTEATAAAIPITPSPQAASWCQAGAGPTEEHRLETASSVLATAFPSTASLFNKQVFTMLATVPGSGREQ